MSAEESNNQLDIALATECFEDELSPVQILAYQEAYELFDKSSKTLNSLMSNGIVMYENNLTSLIYVYNNNASSECLHILPDDETTNDNIVTEDVPNDSFRLLHNNCLECESMITDPLSSKCPMEDLIRQHVITTVSNSFVDTSNSNLTIMDKDKIKVVNEKWVHPLLKIEAKPSKIFMNMQNNIKDHESRLHVVIQKLISCDEKKFIDWLLKQELINNGQDCQKHCRETSMKCQLEMKQDVCIQNMNFPYTGGYFWVSECCPSNYISIFKGTIFEGAPHGPTVQIILLYYWSCQTNILNIMQEVNVKASYLRAFYTNLRGVCTAAMHEECKSLLGGKNKMVEVGFIHMGIKTGVRFKKVCILGVLDFESKRINLEVLRKDYKNTKGKRYENRLLFPLIKLINKNSIILTDLRLCRSLFTDIGFKNVYQRPIQDRIRKKTYSNENIMLYLRKRLPRVFGNTVSALNETLIQQFLDELCWRETWGMSPLKAFHAIVDHIGEQTKLCPGFTLSYRLSTIARYPFMNWQYSNWGRNIQILGVKTKKIVDINKTCSITPSISNKSAPSTRKINMASKKVNKRQEAKKITIKNISHKYSSSMNRSIQTRSNLVSTVKKLNCNNYKTFQELISLENYYYGTIPGSNCLIQPETKDVLNMKCILCDIPIKTNICLMKHIIDHAFCTNSDSVGDKNWCKYCLQARSKKYRYSKTLFNCAGSHLRSSLPQARCLICETNFIFRTKLILHMHFSHNELELPYECNVCQLRSSQHHIIVDHFYESHCNGENAQCPLCLKVVAFKDNKGAIIPQNIYLFLNHMKRHISKVEVIKCSRCVLSFVNKTLLAYHEKSHHNSCKDMSNVERYSSTKIMMPFPEMKSSDTPVCKADNIMPLDLAKTCSKFKKFNIIITVKFAQYKALCCECGDYLMSQNHLTGEFACLTCRFKTCCAKAMFQHDMNFHNKYYNCELYRTESKKVLNNVMYCVCGFKSMCGNKLAEHLVYCGKTSVYNTLT